MNLQKLSQLGKPCFCNFEFGYCVVLSVPWPPSLNGKAQIKTRFKGGGGNSGHFSVIFKKEFSSLKNVNLILTPEADAS